MLITAALIVSRLQADDLAFIFAAAPTQQPDNLVTFQWIAITTLGGVIGGMALYIRQLLTEIRAIEKERHAHDLAVSERMITVILGSNEAAKDTAEAIRILADKLEKANTRERRNNGSKKTS